MASVLTKLFEERKDKERVRIDQALVKHFSKHGKVLDVTPEGEAIIEGDVEIKHNYDGTKLPLKFKSVTGYYTISDVPIDTLEGSPETALKVDVSGLKIKSLHGVPQTKLGLFASNLNIQNLEGIKDERLKNLMLDGTHLASLKGAPKHITSKMRINASKLKSLEHLPEEIGELIIVDMPKPFPILRIFLSKIGSVSFIGGEDGSKVAKVVEKHLKDGRKGALEAQREMIDVGLEDYAKV